jgi:PAS domain S-box-containing protein
MLKNLKIGLRLSIGFALVFLLLISLTLFGINRMELLSEQTSLLYNHPLTVSNAVLRINANIIKIHRSMKDVVLAQDNESISEYSRIAEALEKDIFRDFDVINKKFLGEKEKYEIALETFTMWKPIRDEVLALMYKGEREKAANITTGKGARHVVQIEKVMEALSDFAQLKAIDFLNDTEVTRLNAFHLMYLLIICSVLVSILLAVFITKSFTVPIRILEEATEKIGRGQLDTAIDINSKDEIGQLATSFNKMTVDLKNISKSHDQLNKEINERKKAEKELRQYECIVSNSNDMMALLSIDFIYLAVNDAYINAFNMTKDQILGHTVSEIFGDVFFKETIRPNAKVCLEGKEVRYSVWFNFPSLGRKYMEVEYSPYFGFGKEIKGFVVNGRDITKRKQAEDQLERLNAELKRSNTELEQFAFIASHDLKSPLLTISSFASLLKKQYDDKLDKKSHEYIDFIVNSTNRMENLITGLLTYSRIGISSSQLQPIDVNKIFVRAIANLTLDIEKNGAKITHDSLPTVFGDDTQLEQLLQNLIGNSIKYHSQESPRVHISAKQKDGNWVFSVKDNGIGISSENREKIFDMFHCLSRGKYKGTGIGLAICKKIVELHGGKIWVESKPRKGSVFYFTIRTDGITNHNNLINIQT